jgi:hypothetical protein
MNRKWLLGLGLVGIGAVALAAKSSEGTSAYPSPPLPTTPSEQQEVVITIVAWPINDKYSRYHGVTVDQALNKDFYTTQPGAKFAISGSKLTHTFTVTLAKGTHTVEYGNSGYCQELEGYGQLNWGARIIVNEIPLQESECVGKDNHLKASFKL